MKETTDVSLGAVKFTLDPSYQIIRELTDNEKSPVIADILTKKDILYIADEYNNIIFWSFDLNNYKKSNWWKRTATESVKDEITIRTANTMKKILELCNK